MQQHGGRITVDSGAEGGTIFTITLPALSEDPAAAAACDDPALFTGQGETVLIVEDEVPVRHTLAQILGDLNYRVLVAPSAEDAVTVYDAHAGEVALVLDRPRDAGDGWDRPAARARANAPARSARRDDVGLRRRGRQRDDRGRQRVGAEAGVGPSARPDHPGKRSPPRSDRSPGPDPWPREYDGAAMPGYRFAAFWATVVIVLGMLLAVGGVVLAAAAIALDMPWGSFDRPGRPRARAGRRGPRDLGLLRRRAVHRAGRDDSALPRHCVASRGASTGSCAGSPAAPTRCRATRPRSRRPPTACFRADRKGRRRPRGRLRGSRQRLDPEDDR